MLQAAYSPLKRFGLGSNPRQSTKFMKGRILSRKNERTKRKNEVIHKQNFLRAYKQTLGCRDCGYSEHCAALQFHHRNPSEKTFNLAGCENFTWQMIHVEVEKCDVLCSNCHAIHEFEQKKVNQSVAGASGSILAF